MSPSSQYAKPRGVYRNKGRQEYIGVKDAFSNRNGSSALFKPGLRSVR